MDYTLYDSNGLLISGKAKLLQETKDKVSLSREKKVALVFKYDRSGILSVAWAEAILSLPEKDKEDKTKDQSFAMELTQELHGTKFMNRVQKTAAWKLKDTFL